MMLCVTLRREPDTVNAPPIAASFAHVKVPVILGLVRMFVFSCAITPPYNAWHVKVPQVRSVVTFNAFAATMPVNVGLARGALRAKALIDAVLRGLSKSVVLSTLANLKHLLLEIVLLLRLWIMVLINQLCYHR